MQNNLKDDIFNATIFYFNFNYYTVLQSGIVLAFNIYTGSFFKHSIATEVNTWKVRKV